MRKLSEQKCAILECENKTAFGSFGIPRIYCGNTCYRKSTSAATFRHYPAKIALQSDYELMEACGKHFDHLVKEDGVWSAYAANGEVFAAPTSREALISLLASVQ